MIKKPKKPAEKTSKQPQIAPNPAISEPESPEPDSASSAPEREPEIAKSACFRYHHDSPPRVFRAGEAIPSGWIDKNVFGWVNNPDGSWSRG